MPATRDSQTATRRWWSVSDIAEDLDVSVHTVYKWSAVGLPYFPKAIRLRNGQLRVRDDWYEEWLVSLESARRPLT